MYSVVVQRTGQVLARNLTLDGVDRWLARNESRYAGFRTVGMTIFVAAVDLPVDGRRGTR